VSATPKVWHAYASAVSLTAGTGMLVTGGSDAVDLLAGEAIGIELPDGEQITAEVTSCAGGLLILAVRGGTAIELHRVQTHPDFAEFKLSDGFSRQIWTVH
jgi:hypothetical protein